MKISKLPLIAGLAISFGAILLVCNNGSALGSTTLDPMLVNHIRDITNKQEKSKPKEVPVSESEMEKAADRCFKNSNCFTLAQALYHEDRGDINGMKAVANVVMNRVEGGRWPNSISGVINQKGRNSRGVVVCQFSYVCLKRSLAMHETEWKIKAGWVAWQAFTGELRDRTNGADHYYNPKLVRVKPGFARAYPHVATVGEHYYYKSIAGR